MSTIKGDIHSFATELIGKEDAQRWYTENKDLFEHGDFVPVSFDFADEMAHIWAHRPIREGNQDLRNVLDFGDLRFFQNLGQVAYPTDNRRWAHTHPSWRTKFGVYVLRQGETPVKQTRNIVEVRSWLQGGSAGTRTL